MNLISTRRIIAVHVNIRVWDLSEISRATRMIEDHLLVKLFQFRAQEKNRAAACKISIIRSTSDGVL